MIAKGWNAGMEGSNTEQLPHQLKLDDRERMTVSGVTDVESFDEQTVQLLTTCGALTVSGRELHIEQLQLETGELRLSGRVDSLIYTDRQPHRSFFGRLFR